MSHLNSRQQQAAIAQFQAVTNGTDEDLAINVLESAGWDVQRAIEFVLGGEPPQTTPRHLVQMQIDDSSASASLLPRATRHPPPPPPPRPSLSYLSRPFFTVLAFPLHILSNVFRFIFSVLRIPIPRISFSTLTFYSPLQRRPLPRGSTGSSGNGSGSNNPLSSGTSLDRWIRQLEEETGAVSIGRMNVTASTTATDAGPSSLTARSNRILSDQYDQHGNGNGGVKLLPDFTLGSYDEVLKICQREARIGCIMLVSEEHDDVSEFKHSTLTDATLVKLLYDNNIVVWGGDVREHEAWSAAEKLQATTFPFVAFVALQPRRTPIASSRPTSTSSSSSSSPTLTVLSRHQGPSTPNGPTHPLVLTDHITNQLLPRVTPFLSRIQQTQRDRERDRIIREEQDAAFRQTAERDRERIEGKMEEERRERERLQLAREEEERKRAREADEARERERRMAWRRWIRRMYRGIVEYKGSGGHVRVAVRLPNGGRVIRTFGEDETLTSLYAFVDGQLVPPGLNQDDDPTTSPDGSTSSSNLETCIENQINSSSSSSWWGFQLALAYPRKEIPWIYNTKLGQVDALKGGGGQIVVEMLQRDGVHEDDDDDDDDEE